MTTRIFELRVFGLRTYPAVLRGSLEDVRMVYGILKSYADMKQTRTPNLGIFYNGKEFNPQEKKWEKL